MEHSDFNQIDLDNERILSFEESERNLGKIILEHVAKLQTLNIQVHPAVLDRVMLKLDKYRDYFNKCKNELFEAKNMRLESSWITFYDLLVDSKKKIKNYAGNFELIEDFQTSNCVEKFPIYGASIDENVRKGMKRRELFDKSSIALSKCLPVFNPNHLIVRDILNCVLSIKNLSKLCQ